MEIYFNHKLKGQFRIGLNAAFYYEPGGTTFIYVNEPGKNRAVFENIHDISIKKIIYMKQDGAYELVYNWKGVIRRTYSECENLCEKVSDLEKALQNTMVEFENNPSIAEKVVVTLKKYKKTGQNTVMRKFVVKGQC